MLVAIAFLAAGTVAAQAPAPVDPGSMAPGTEVILVDDEGARMLAYGRVVARSLDLTVTPGLERGDDLILIVVAPDGSLRTFEARVRSGSIVLDVDDAPTVLDAWLLRSGVTLRTIVAGGAEPDRGDASAGRGDDGDRDDDDDADDDEDDLDDDDLDGDDPDDDDEPDDDDVDPDDDGDA